MKTIYILLSLLIFLLSSCNPNSNNSKEKYIESIQKKEFENHVELYENAGEIIGEFTFDLKADENQKKDWEDGIIPWININNPENEINQLINANEILVKEQVVNIIFDYPLSKPTSFEFKNDKGFSREELILLISKKYHEIYTEEENSSKTKTIPIEKRTGIINRNETDGKYGIWGHDLSDLVLSGIEVRQTSDKKINLILLIES